jgi:hypothetical protein
MLAMSATAAVAAAGCTSDAAPASDPADYRADLTAICVASSAEQSVLADPVDDAGVASFARAVADVLTRQADAARALQSPDDLDDDHRAFVQNTADQAAQWSNLATTPSDDAGQFGAIQTNILELTLGRDDLATAMDVPACRVTPA